MPARWRVSLNSFMARPPLQPRHRRAREWPFEFWARAWARADKRAAVQPPLKSVRVFVYRAEVSFQRRLCLQLLAEQVSRVRIPSLAPIFNLNPVSSLLRHWPVRRHERLVA